MTLPQACWSGVGSRSMSTARPKVSIRLVRADGGPETLVLMKTEFLTCGRTSEVSIPDDPFVAAAQARFFFTGHRLAVEDVGRGNGLFFRLKQETELLTGSELRLGRQRLSVEKMQPVIPLGDGTIPWGSPDPGYRFRLVTYLEGGIRGSAFPIREGETSLGREHGDITFPADGFVSGRHAQFFVKMDKLQVKDLGSSNGTFIRLTQPTLLEHNDQLLLGRQLLRVELAP
jgi:hypothetical protein